MKYIAPGLYTFEGLFVGRAYLLEDADGLTIIDGSLAPMAVRLLRQITGSGRRLTDVKRILLTHAHQDHVGALPMLREKSGAPIITSEIEKPYAEGKIPVARPDAAALTGMNRRMASGAPTVIKGITVDQTVSDGDVIEAFGGLQVIATPGHTRGHLSFWQPERKILFAGDVMMHTFGSLRLPFAVATPDMAEDVRSIQKVAALDAEIVCFGHGEPLTQDAAAQIRTFAKKIAMSS